MMWRFGLGIVAVLFAAIAPADSWRWSARTEVFKFAGGLRFEYRIRPFDRGYQAHTDVVVKRRGKVLASYSELGIGQMFASPDNTLFVALSNSGLPGTAVAVFDEEGKLWLHAEHGVAEFAYCEQSIIVVREWYDGHDPDLRFDVERWLAGVTLNDCRGKRINLQQAVSEALVRGIEKTGKRVGDHASQAEPPMPPQK
jgi:hypothetical protein